ncbi:hypothetical protein ABT354_36825 [Streptomyces sp. NPDC000594]|uniref:hypothetical protein n=1 Tax=Streptomyces sp. NPDC000594 TaxID=3154261 RepID=UPI0033169E4F
MTGLVAAACAGVLLASVPAGAAPAPAPETSRATSGPHCATHVETRKTTCYDTFREAVSATTGGRVTNATQAKAAKDSAFVDKVNETVGATAGTAATSRAASDFFLGVIYEHTRFRGASHQFWGDGPCNDFSDQEYWMVDLLNWNNRISSLKTGSNCDIELFSERDFNGAHQLYFTNTPNVGSAMNDQAESMVWK